MQSILSMIESASVILLSTLIVANFGRWFEVRPYLKGLLLGSVFALTGLVVMSNPVEIIPGVRTDPRATVVVLSAALGGPLSVAVTAPCLALLRLSYGGAGAVPGAAYILGVGLVAAAVWYWWFRIARKPIDFWYIVLQSVVAGIVPTLILLCVASSVPWGPFLVSNSLFAPTNFAATLMMGAMVLRDLERQAAIAARAETQARIDTIANNAPAILFQIVCEAEGAPKFTYVSDAARTILGVEPTALMSDYSALGPIVGDDLEKIERALRASRATQRPWNLEVECIRPTGSKVWMRFDAGIRTDASGRVIWDGSISDITEHKIAEQMKDNFISTVSHELRTPLTAIRGALGLVVGISAGQMPAKASSMLEIANRNAERLVLLINDILDMQKIRSGHMELTLRQETLRPLLDQALVAAQNYAPTKKIRFVLSDEAPKAQVSVDADRLNQVLMNLLSNAIKFSPDTGTVTLSSRYVDGGIRLSVADEGPGIPQEFRDRIFDRFTQAEDSSTRSTGGTGLGLNIAKAIVDAMNGSMGFHSVEGQGAEFYVDLPVAADVDTQAPRPLPATSRQALICGTDPQANQLVSTILTKNGFLTDVATDPGTAFELAGGRQYTILILDKGAKAAPDLLELIRGDARTRDLPFVTIDGTIDEDGLMRRVTLALNPAERSRPHVLYVEDDPHLQEVIRQNLGSEVRTSSATSMAAARDMLERHTFDLILLDLELPDGWGLDVLAEVPADVPVIVFSAFEVDRDVADRVTCVMTKSRIKEIDVVQAILAELTERPARDARQLEVA